MRTDGDSLTAAFHDAVDAVGWAVAAQEALLAHPWSGRLMQHPYCAPVTLVRGWGGEGEEVGEGMAESGVTGAVLGKAVQQAP